MQYQDLVINRFSLEYKFTCFNHNGFKNFRDILVFVNRTNINITERGKRHNSYCSVYNADKRL